jgi:hypothetical protein
MPYLGKSPSFGVRQRYQYTATASQTTFSGTDTANLTLNYTDNNFVDVYQNGVLLKGGGNDYTATSGTSVVLATGATADDVIEIIVYDAFSAANFYSRTDSDSRYVRHDSGTLGTDNFIAGNNAGDAIASGGNYNTVVGNEAGTAITTGDNNTAVGFEALATEDADGNNTAVGYRALKTLNAGTDADNVAVGKDAGLSVTTGIRNTLIGGRAGDALTDADFNVAIGEQALTSDTKGNKTTAVGQSALASQNQTSSTDTHNTAVGHNSGLSVTTGKFNNLIGSGAGDALTVGNSNVAIGYNALTADTKGDNSVAIGDQALLNQNFTSSQDSFNVAVGANAGQGCTSGEKNTFIGGKAGGDNTQSGSRNACLGWEVGFNLTSGNNNILVGHQAGRSASPSGTINSGSDTICLGDDNINDFFCNDTSISSSDSRDKADIADFNIGLNWIKDLRPVTYKWDKRSWYGTDEEPYGTPDGSKKKSKVHIGFLAQEVLEIEKANGFADDRDNMLTCNLTEDGQRYGMKYERLVPILVNAVQELSAKNDALEARIKKLEDG